MIAKDASNHQALDADPKVIKQINFTENCNGDRNVMKIQQYFLLLKKWKKLF